jgi:hypothetical protein
MKRAMFVAAMTILAGAGTADARGIAAFSGRAADSNQQSCFTTNTNIGWVTNTQCSGAPAYIIALDTDTNGSKTINIGVEIAESFATTSCHSVAVARNGIGATLSPVRTATQAGVLTNLLLQGSNVTSQGLLYVECDVGQNGSLIQVDWNN